MTEVVAYCSYLDPRTRLAHLSTRAGVVFEWPVKDSFLWRLQPRKWYTFAFKDGMPDRLLREATRTDKDFAGATDTPWDDVLADGWWKLRTQPETAGPGLTLALRPAMLTLYACA